MSRAGRKDKRASGRDGGAFVALPWSVLDSAAFRNLSANARALLLEVARQDHGDDNGRLLLSRAYLGPRGWTSSDMITKAKRELLANRLIFQTVLGQRPNKASWYAVTWRALDRLPGFDAGAEQTFERGAYRETPPKPARRDDENPPPPARRDAFLAPPHGTERPDSGKRRSPLTVPRYSVAPYHGTESTPAVPYHGAIRALSDPPPVPYHGHPLDLPSTGPSSPACVEPGKGARNGGRPPKRPIPGEFRDAGAHQEGVAPEVAPLVRTGLNGRRPRIARAKP